MGYALKKHKLNENKKLKRRLVKNKLYNRTTAPRDPHMCIKARRCRCTVFGQLLNTLLRHDCNETVLIAFMARERLACGKIRFQLNINIIFLLYKLKTAFIIIITSYNAARCQCLNKIENWLQTIIHNHNMTIKFSFSR